MNLTRRTVQSSLLNFSINIFLLILTFVRSVLLARWLEVNLFGIYAYAGSIVTFTLVIPRFGMGGAFLNRVPETENEDSAASVYFTIYMAFISIWAIILSTAGYFIFDYMVFKTLVVLIILGIVTEFSHIPRMILVRRVTHRRLASISLIDSVLSTVASLLIAWFWGGIWALLSVNIVSALIVTIGFYIWKPVWKPKIAWMKSEVKYFLSFGLKNLFAAILRDALDHLDDIWTGFFLGERPLAYYSKAYSFALIPGRLINNRIDSVIAGSFAELKNRRNSLSKAFSLSVELLLRSSFLLGGVAFVVAPELVHLLLGEKWMPMVIPFQLMLIYTLFNPIKRNVGQLFISVGAPKIVIKARLVQLGIMLGGIFVLGFQFGINGVAIAVDLMLVLGLIFQLLLASSFVDFSWKDLFMTPLVSVICGLLFSFMFTVWIHPSQDWALVLVKSLSFSLGYLVVYLCLEYKKLTKVYIPLILNSVQNKQS